MSEETRAKHLEIARQHKGDPDGLAKALTEYNRSLQPASGEWNRKAAERSAPQAPPDPLLVEGIPMQRNAFPEFVGIEKLKEQHAEELKRFQFWAGNGLWDDFHFAHYDWWMFPIDQPSSHGFAWCVFADEIAELQKDAQFIEGYLLGVRLQALSWGWGIEKRVPVENPAADQKWQQWPIRLYKMTRSLWLFGFEAHFESMRQYAHQLVQAGESLVYNGRDLGQEMDSLMGQAKMNTNQKSIPESRKNNERPQDSAPATVIPDNKTLFALLRAGGKLTRVIMADGTELKL